MNNTSWNNPITNLPPENIDVLIYTDTDKMKVARLCHGRWDTYMKVIGWQPLPKNKPNFNKKEK